MMSGSSLCLFVGLVLLVGVAVAVATTSKFDQLFQPSWAYDHFVHEGDLLKLKLDNYSGNLNHPHLIFLYLIDIVFGNYKICFHSHVHCSTYTTCQCGI